MCYTHVSNQFCSSHLWDIQFYINASPQHTGGNSKINAITDQYCMWEESIPGHSAVKYRHFLTIAPYFWPIFSSPLIKRARPILLYRDRVLWRLEPDQCGGYPMLPVCLWRGSNSRSLTQMGWAGSRVGPSRGRRGNRTKNTGRTISGGRLVD